MGDHLNWYHEEGDWLLFIGRGAGIEQRLEDAVRENMRSVGA